jgi:polyhydroxyalkanoate synthase
MDASEREPGNTQLTESINEFIAEYTLLDQPRADTMDHKFKAVLARTTKGMSPLELVYAYLDWLGHLAISPGKLALLVQSLTRKLTQLGLYNLQSLLNADATKPAKLSERQFQSEAWRRWPFTVFAQGYLVSKEWWKESTTGIDGLNKDHERLVSFMAEQILESLSPANFPVTNPEIIKTTIDQRGANLKRGLSNYIGDKARAAIGKPAAGREKFKVGETLAVTPGKVIFQNDLMELIQYAPTTETVCAEPVLIVPAWIMKYYILDLSPKNSMVKYLVDQGKTVFVISWKNPSEKDRDITMDDYLKLGLMAALDVIGTVVPGQQVNSVGYCIGGTLLYIAAALMARENDERLKSISIFAAQADFSEAGEIRTFLSESIYSFLKSLMWKQGYLGLENMGGAFAALRATDLIHNPKVDRYWLGKESSMNDLMAWNADGTRMPYCMHSEYLRTLYMDNDLAECRFVVDGKPIALSDIDAPFFVVGTATDHVAPWPSVYKINRLNNGEVTFLVTSGGHNAGIVSGPSHPRRTYQVQTRKAGGKYVDPQSWIDGAPSHKGSWWPQWNKWLDEHSSEQVKPPAMGASKKGIKVLRDAPGEYVMG